MAGLQHTSPSKLYRPLVIANFFLIKIPPRLCLASPAITGRHRHPLHRQPPPSTSIPTQHQLHLPAIPTNLFSPVTIGSPDDDDDDDDDDDGQDPTASDDRLSDVRLDPGLPSAAMASSQVRSGALAHAGAKITKPRSRKVVKPLLKKLHSHSDRESLDLDRDWDDQPAPTTPSGPTTPTTAPRARPGPRAT
ncbi:hypothetical protein CDD83_5708 [Cordyceps sp. RAO-2017]|nr:hypothetical protein CDD83_5708 [Cordyceps sp. RAO-2017]